MQKIKSGFDYPLALIAEINALPFKMDGSGAEMAFKPSNGIGDLPPILKSLVLEIALFRDQPPLNLMVNKLGPGVRVANHRDWIHPTRHQGKWPTVERWHFPVVTNLEAWFWCEAKGFVHFEAGYWTGPVPYWDLHGVQNFGTTDRIHVVVDLDTPTRVGSYAEELRCTSQHH